MSKTLNLDDNPTFRVDAQYYQKYFLSFPKFTRELGSFCTVKSGTTPSDRDDNLKDGVNLLKTTDIRNLPLSSEDDSSFYKITDSINQRMLSTQVESGDVLLNIVGATTDVVGRVALIPDGFPKSNITQAMALIRVDDHSISEEILFSFLNCKYGYQQILRLARPTGQYNLNLQEVRRIRIPSFCKELCDIVQRAITKAYKYRQDSLKSITQAKKLLTEKLELNDLIIPNPLSYVRNSSDVILRNRWDSEYYSPKIQTLLSMLAKDGQTLGSVATVRKDKFKPHDVEGSFKYIEIGNVKKDGSCENSFLPISEAPSRATQLVENGDVITSTVRPIRELSAIVDEDQDKAVCSSGFVVLTPHSINSETLLTYLKLPVFCELMDLHTSASLYPAISEKDIMSLPIPLIDKNVQEDIKLLITSSREFKKQAFDIFSATKKAVEIAIENNEEQAIKYLKEYC
ncbi:MAG: type I restriction enzyme S subunit [Flavobacteriales bacterium]